MYTTTTPGANINVPSVFIRHTQDNAPCLSLSLLFLSQLFLLIRIPQQIKEPNHPPSPCHQVPVLHFYPSFVSASSKGLRRKLFSYTASSPTRLPNIYLAITSDPITARSSPHRQPTFASRVGWLFPICPPWILSSSSPTPSSPTMPTLTSCPSRLLHMTSHQHPPT